MKMLSVNTNTNAIIDGVIETYRGREFSAREIITAVFDAQYGGQSFSDELYDDILSGVEKKVRAKLSNTRGAFFHKATKTTLKGVRRFLSFSYTGGTKDILWVHFMKANFAHFDCHARILNRKIVEGQQKEKEHLALMKLFTKEMAGGLSKKAEDVGYFLYDDDAEEEEAT